MIDYKLIETRIIPGTHFCHNCKKTCQRWQRGAFTYCAECEPSLAIGASRKAAHEREQIMNHYQQAFENVGIPFSRFRLPAKPEPKVIFIPFTVEQSKQANAA